MLAWLFPDPLPTGAPAPLFTCLDEEGEPFALDQQRGRKVILVFYPTDNAALCTRQLGELRDYWNKLRSLGAVVYGINPAGAESHRRFRERNRFPFPLLVDEGQRAARFYNCNGRVIRRTVYIIQEAGIIRYAKRGRPPITEILRVLKHRWG